MSPQYVTNQWNKKAFFVWLNYKNEKIKKNKFIPNTEKVMWWNSPWCSSLPAETSSCCSWRPSPRPRSPRWPCASSTHARFCWYVPTSPASSSWGHDAPSTSSSPSSRWSPTSSRAPTHRGYPSPTWCASRTIPEEEEHSPAIQRSQILQLGQVSWGENCNWELDRLCSWFVLNY